MGIGQDPYQYLVVTEHFYFYFLYSYLFPSCVFTGFMVWWQFVLFSKLIPIFFTVLLVWWELFCF